MLKDSSSSIDLAFTSQPNMVLNSRVHFSLRPNSHHQIAFSKFNLKVFYPPPYERRDYKYANTVQIKNALASFNWEQALSNSSADKKIFVLNKIINNVMNNYIPNKAKVFDEQNPPWMNEDIGNLITAKMNFLKSILKITGIAIILTNIKRCKGK